MSHPNEGRVEPMNAAVASSYVRAMVHRESAEPGDHERVMKAIADKYGIGFWTLDRLRRRRTKTLDIGVFARIRAAYLDLCERQVSKLQREIEIEKAILGDDSLEDLSREAAELVARVQARKALTRGGRRHG